MDYRQLAAEVVQQARQGGAEAEAFIGVGYETKIQVARGDVEKLSNAGIRGLGVRVIREGRMGYAYTSDFTAASVAQTVAEARALVAVATPDDHRRLPERQPLPEENLEIYDPGVAARPMAEKIAFAQALEAAALAADPRVKLTDRTTYVDTTVDYYLVNSQGFAGHYQKSFVFSYLRAVAIDGQDRAWAHGGHGSTFGEDLDAGQIGATAPSALPEKRTMRFDLKSRCYLFQPSIYSATSGFEAIASLLLMGGTSLRWKRWMTVSTTPILTKV